MKHTGYRNADLIQPLRAKDRNKSDKKSIRGPIATPEFDKAGHRTPHGVSPLKKDLSQHKIYQPPVEDKPRPGLSPYRAAAERNSKAGFGEPKLSEREHHPGRSKNVSPVPLATPPEEKLDSSFELEEKRIRRENLAKEFLTCVARVADTWRHREQRELVENLRKQSRIFEVQMEYAIQQRDGHLKAEFLANLHAAAQKYNYRRKLIRNFARVLNRPVKTHLGSVLEQAWYQIRHLRIALYKPHARKTSTKTGPTHIRSNTSSMLQEVSKSIPVDTFGVADVQASSQIKKTDTSKQPKPKIKIEESRADKNRTPVKDTAPRRTEASKEQGKAKEPPKKPEARGDLQPIKSKELPSKKSTGIVQIKPYSVNSSREDLNLSASKVRQSAASDLKPSSVQQRLEQSGDKRSETVSVMDNNSAILNKHLELKKKLLRQIRGEDGTDTEDLEESTPKALVGRPYTDESVHKLSSRCR